MPGVHRLSPAESTQSPAVAEKPWRGCGEECESGTIHSQLFLPGEDTASYWVNQTPRGALAWCLFTGYPESSKSTKDPPMLEKRSLNTPAPCHSLSKATDLNESSFHSPALLSAGGIWRQAGTLSLTHLLICLFLHSAGDKYVSQEGRRETSTRGTTVKKKPFRQQPALSRYLDAELRPDSAVEMLHPQFKLGLFPLMKPVYILMCMAH